ncbi:MAG: hypothetical protein LBU67_10165 [Oscillospiraceae bacterium]|jgi:hypothetical protein|nr:hypothetical protein [Oscillospiraceae bacterium]
MRRALSFCRALLLCLALLLALSATPALTDGETEATLYVTCAVSPRKAAADGSVTMQSKLRVGKALPIGTPITPTGTSPDGTWVSFTGEGGQTLYIRRGFLSPVFEETTLPLGTVLYNEAGKSARNWSSIVSADVGGKMAYIIGREDADTLRVLVPNSGAGRVTLYGYAVLDESSYDTGFQHGGEKVAVLTIAPTNIYLKPTFSTRYIQTTYQPDSHLYAETVPKGQAWTRIYEGDVHIGYALVGCLTLENLAKQEELKAHYRYLLLQPGREALGAYATVTTWRAYDWAVRFQEAKGEPVKAFFPEYTGKNGDRIPDGTQGFILSEDYK